MIVELYAYFATFARGLESNAIFCPDIFVYMPCLCLRFVILKKCTGCTDRVFWSDKEIKFLTLCASLQKKIRVKYLYDSSLLICITIFLQNLLHPIESNKISYKGDIT